MEWSGKKGVGQGSYKHAHLQASVNYVMGQDGVRTPANAATRVAAAGHTRVQSFDASGLNYAETNQEIVQQRRRLETNTRQT
jgi:hypothetical protein